MSNQPLIVAAGKQVNNLQSEGFDRLTDVLQTVTQERMRIGAILVNRLFTEFADYGRFFFGDTSYSLAHHTGVRLSEVVRESTVSTGAGPAIAVMNGLSWLANNEVDVVVIAGQENLGDISAQDGGRKRILSRIDSAYGTPIWKLYNRLAHRFSLELGIEPDKLRDLIETASQNMQRTYRELNGVNPVIPPKASRFLLSGDAQDYFRTIDCARPYENFFGTVVLANASMLERLDLTIDQTAAVHGSGFRMVGLDNPDGLDQIAKYEHTAGALLEAFQNADIPHCNAKRMLQDGEMQLHGYSCFPFVPLRILHVMGFSPNEMNEFMEENPITSNSGMYFAQEGGPWNCPVISTLVDAYTQILNGKFYVLTDANGGICELQASIVTGRPTR
jgi:hypothetical protein